MSTFDDLMALVDRLATRFPLLPRLTILDAVEAEFVRLGANVEPYLMPFVGPAALWRLRIGAEPAF